MEYNQIIQGNTLSVLQTLPPEIVNCCVTSPPYWGLRDYGIEPVIWDGVKPFNVKTQGKVTTLGCEHEWVTNIKKPNGGKGSKGANVGANKNDFANMRDHNIETDFCIKCNAWRGSLGLEPTFELYIKHLCDIFDEVWRVLRKDGTCWVNLGDTYNGGNGQGGNTNGKHRYNTEIDKAKAKMPTKSLCLIPQRFAIEMVNRGWILRNTIIWHKPNCMPSSAKDRFTVDFEYVYFFVKSKKYWFEQAFEDNETGYRKDKWEHRTYSGKWDKATNGKKSNGAISEYNLNPQGRNKRAVWTIPTKPFPEAHFAVYPEALISPMIQAGCPRYVCKKCGKAREKIYERQIDFGTEKSGTKYIGLNAGSLAEKRQAYRKLGYESPPRPKEIGYTDCGCNAGFEGGIVLDPFMGAGTTAVVAKKQGKRYLGIELKQEYIDMANKRIRKIPELLF